MPSHVKSKAGSVRHAILVTGFPNGVKATLGVSGTVPPLTS